MHESAFPLTVYAGATAYRQLLDKGWQPDLFTAMVGASGGAKLLGLGHLDRVLFADYLQRSDHPMELYGSSIGSWRHAALAAADPGAAIRTLQERYLNQQWDDADPRSRTAIVDGLCEWVLGGVIDDAVAHHITCHPRFTTHVITARGKGLNGARHLVPMALGMGLSALANVASRRLLGAGFQRVVFSTGAQRTFRFDDFATCEVPLGRGNLKAALLASGSIPLLMSGQRDIADAPPGHYWDGGIIDYHFDFTQAEPEGLILYPHFSSDVFRGWFDKSLRWRRTDPALLDRTVLIAPSPAYLATLPGGRIPDRKDFQRYSQTDRLHYWRTALDKSETLAGAFLRMVAEDPRRFVTQVGR